MADFDDVDLEIEPPPLPPPWRARIAALAGILVLVVLGVLAVANAGGDPAPESAEPDRADVDEPPVADDQPVPIDAAGRYDGLDSVRLPLEITPDVDLVDGMDVTARGAGYTPNATVAIIQCAGVDGSGSVDDCDLSNYELGSADGQGFVDMTLTVRRYIANGDGEVDCALATVSCAIAIGNISDYDESGVANVWFDGNVDGVRSPVITVSPAVGLRDGDPLTVEGANFEPGDSVLLSQCVIGGAYSFGACFAPSHVTDTVEVAADGTFSVVVSARRELSDGIDCFDDVYGCRMAATGTNDAPNPVPLYFDGSVRPPSGVALTLDPGFDLSDGTAIIVAVDQVPLDGPLTIRQCVLQDGIGLTCGPTVSATVVDGAASMTYVVAQFLANAAGDLVDCAEPGRVCELRVDGVHEQRVPLQFAADS